MTINEIIRLRERILWELHGGSAHGAPSTRLIRLRPDGFLLELNHAGERVILSSEGDLDRHLRRLGRFV